MKEPRRRYYIVGFDSPFVEISRAMRAQGYNELNPIGFELIEVGKAKLTCKYIEKKSIPEEIHDPFGNTETVVHVKYIICLFDMIHVSAGKALLVLTNPPASIRNIIRALSEVVGDAFSIDKLVFDADDLRQYLLNHVAVDRVLVKEIAISAFPFSKHAVASMTIKSNADAYNDLKSRYKKNSYSIDKMAMRVRMSGNEEFVSIAASGASCFSRGLNELMEHYVIGKVKQ